MIVFIKAFAIFKSSIVLATVKKTLFIWNCSYPSKLKWRTTSVQKKSRKGKFLISAAGFQIVGGPRKPVAGKVSLLVLSLSGTIAFRSIAPGGMYFHLDFKL